MTDGEVFVIKDDYTKSEIFVNSFKDGKFFEEKQRSHICQR